MKLLASARGAAWLAVLAVGLCAASGCTSLGRRARSFPHGVGLYLQDRFEDAMEMVDLGFTITFKPGFALYADAGSVAPVGGGHISGWFVGIGGGQLLGIGHGRFLATRHYFLGGGVGVWGYEEFGWNVYDTEDLSSLRCVAVGLPPLFAEPYSRPGTWPSFRSYAHAGYLGIVGNANLFEALDFIFGFIGLDFCGDDGVPLGKWPWQTYDEADVESFEYYNYHRGFETY